MKTSAIIAAAGSGKRMGAGTNKQWILLKGIPMLARTLTVFQSCPVINEIVIAAAPQEVEDVKQLAKEYKITKVTEVVAGGQTRQQSVSNALKTAQGELVLVHDGARPFVTEEELIQVTKAVEQYGIAALGMKVKDTIKLVSSDGTVEQTLPREQLWAAATPQGFFREQLLQLHEQWKNTPVTDDCMLAELSGKPVKMVLCGNQNIKITTPEDLAFAEVILSSSADTSKR